MIPFCQEVQEFIGACAGLQAQLRSSLAQNSTTGNRYARYDFEGHDGKGDGRRSSRSN